MIGPEKRCGTCAHLDLESRPTAYPDIHNCLAQTVTRGGEVHPRMAGKKSEACPYWSRARLVAIVQDQAKLEVFS